MADEYTTIASPIYGLSKDKNSKFFACDAPVPYTDVARYFGGKKCGLQGLRNAYRQAGSDILNRAQIVMQTVNVQYFIRCPITHIGGVMNFLNQVNVAIEGQKLSNACSYVIEIDQDDQRTMQELAKYPAVDVDPFT